MSLSNGLNYKMVSPETTFLYILRVLKFFLCLFMFQKERDRERVSGGGAER